MATKQPLTFEIKDPDLRQAIGLLTEAQQTMTAYEQALIYCAIMNGGSLVFTAEQHDKVIRPYVEANVPIDFVVDETGLSINVPALRSRAAPPDAAAEHDHRGGVLHCPVCLKGEPEVKD